MMQLVSSTAHGHRAAWRRAALLFCLALIATACGGGDAGGTSPGVDTADVAATDAATPDEAATDEATDAADAGDGEVVTLRFSWWGSDSRHEETQEVIDRFEEANPDIRIEGEFTGWSDYWDRLATTVAGGDTPDIVQHESRYLREYADRGALLDMNEVSDVLDLSQIDPLVADSGTVDGAIYGVPTGVNAYVLYADPQAFEEAGVEMPDDTSWSWDDFVETAAAITEATGGEVYGAQDKGFNETDLQVFARQRGEEMYNEDGSIGFSEETATEWWQIGLDMLERGATPDASITTEVQAGGVDQSLIATNRGAMAFFWTNELGSLRETSGRDLQMLRYPGETQHERPGMFFKPAMYYSISATTEHPEEAARFVDFLLNDPAAAEIIKSDRGLPANLQIREDILPELTEADQDAAEFLADIEDELDEQPPVPPIGAGEVVTIVQRLNEQVLFKQLTPAEAAQQLISEAEAATGG